MRSSAPSHWRSARPFDSADHDVRPQPPDVAPELGQGTVRRDEERENVEPGKPAERRELGIVACCAPHQCERLGRVPRVAVDQRTPGRIERAAETQEPVLTARGSDSLRAPDVNYPIAGNPVQR